MTDHTTPRVDDAIERKIRFGQMRGRVDHWRTTTDPTTSVFLNDLSECLDEVTHLDELLAQKDREAEAMRAVLRDVAARSPFQKNDTGAIFCAWCYIRTDTKRNKHAASCTYRRAVELLGQDAGEGA